jgi:hypothetical protein
MVAAKRIPVGFEIVDRYLLGDPVSKPDVVAALLSERSAEPAAAPFYRALEAVGARAADEAFVALRLVLAGKPPLDENVRRLRALAAVARACATGDRTGLAAIVKRDRAQLTDLPLEADPATLGAAARAAYARSFE